MCWCLRCFLFRTWLWGGLTGLSVGVRGFVKWADCFFVAFVG